MNKFDILKRLNEIIESNLDMYGFFKLLELKNDLENDYKLELDSKYLFINKLKEFIKDNE